MIEISGAPMETVGRMSCEICYASCGRFPYLLKVKTMEKPATVCRSCYRTALVIEYLKIRGAFEVIA